MPSLQRDLASDPSWNRNQFVHSLAVLKIRLPESLLEILVFAVDPQFEDNIGNQWSQQQQPGPSQQC